MVRVLVTGAAAGLGLGAAGELIGEGHSVLVHARTEQRASENWGRAPVQIVTGDLSSLEGVRSVAHQVDQAGGVDAVIHNAGVLRGAALLPVNVVAPYLLTALVPAQRHIYLSSSMHRDGVPVTDGLDWSGRSVSSSYSDTKLLVTVLAAAVGRLRPGVFSNAVDPGWVPTRMGGPSAPDDLEAGHQTQVWLAIGDDLATHVSGYWFHRRRQSPSAAVDDSALQDALLAALAAHTGQHLVS